MLCGLAEFDILMNVTRFQNVGQIMRKAFEEEPKNYQLMHVTSRPDWGKVVRPGRSCFQACRAKRRTRLETPRIHADDALKMRFRVCFEQLHADHEDSI